MKTVKPSSQKHRNRKRHGKKFRRLLLELLEDRRMLASDWQNVFTIRDTNDDKVVSPVDALVGINELNQPTIIAAVTGELPARSEHVDAPLYDVNDDGFLSPLDVLLVINGLNEDGDAPQVTVGLQFDSATGGVANNDRITFAGAITGSAIDDLTGIGRVEYAINGGAFQTVEFERDGSFSIQPALAEGEQTIVVRAVDGRNFIGEAESFRFTFDSAAPEVAFNNPGPHVTRNNLSITGQVTDLLAGVESLLAQIDLADTVVVPVAADGTFNFTASLPTDSSADGQHLVRFRATDKAGNLSTLKTVDWKLDTRRPVITTNADAIERTALSTIELSFSEDVAASAFAAANYVLTRTSGPNAPATMPISSVGQFDPRTAQLVLPAALGNFNYRLEVLPVVTDLAGNAPATSQFNFTIEKPTRLAESSPANGEERVSLTRETIIRFDGQVDPATITPESFFLIANSERLPGHIRVSSTERFATFFYENPLPASTEVRIKVNGDEIMGRDGLPLDADNNGQPGGTLQADFRTLPLTFIPGTRVFGYIFDSYNRNPDGSDIPVVGATISLDANPNVFAVTDATGFFELGLQDLNNDGTADGLPAPEFFVHIDGSTATNAPADTAYATLGKPFHTVPGQREQLNMAGIPFDIYLPPMSMSDIVQLNPNADTEVGFGPAAQEQIRRMFADDPAEAQLIIEKMHVTYPLGSAQDQDGVPATQATIIPVEPDRLPAPLPLGAEPTLVVSIQAGTAAGFNLAGGSTSFDTPAPVSFPNLDGLAPGSETLIWSFDHDAGKWGVVGTATISTDGSTAVADPGVGILAPGWHFLFAFVPFLPSPAGGGGCNQNNGNMNNEEKLQACIEFHVSTYNTNYFIAAAEHTAAAVACVALGSPIPVAICEATNLAVFFARVRLLALTRDQGIKECLEKFAPDCVDVSNGGSPNPTGQSNGVSSAEGESELMDDVPTARDETAAAIIASLLELNSVLSPYLESPESITDEVADEVLASLNEILSVSQGNPSQILMTEALDTEIFAFGTGLGEQPDPKVHSVAYAAEIISESGSRIVVRGQTLSRGQYSVLVPLDGRLRLVAFYDRITQSYGEVQPFLRAGISYQLPHPVFIPVDLIAEDADSDGLPDVVEFVIGTSSSRADSDNDGLNDAAEVQQGLDPLGGRSFPTGIIASLSLRGEAKEAVLEGSAQNAQLQLAFLATGSHGLAIVNVTQFDSPIVLGQLDLPGDAQDVAVDAISAVAVIAASEGGLHFVDVSDPMLPKRVRTASFQATQVEIVDGVVYAAADGKIASFDPVSGDLIETHLVPNTTTFMGLAREGRFLYAADTNRQFRVFEVRGLRLIARGSIEVPQSNGKISVNNGIVYLGTQPVYSNGGFVTLDVSDPDQPSVISESDVIDPFIAPGFAIVPNGSGLGLAIGNASSGDGGVARVAIVDASDPTVTDNYLTVFTLPALAQSVAIASGIGYIADGTSGLIVANYVPFDNLGQPPTATATGPAGTTVQEGSFVPVRVVVTDDVQVRDVELLLDGQVVMRDVSAPFDLRAVTPALASGATNVTLQVRATDTGGNVGLSEVLTYTLTPDITPPEIIGSSPADESAGFRVSALTLRFDEPLDAARLALSGFTLTNLGPNFRVGGGDDTPVALDRIEALSPQRVVVYTQNPLPEGRYRLTGDATVLADVAGNQVTAPVGITFTSFDFDEQNAIAWISDSDGDWNEPGNWSTGEVPGPNDTVIIDRKTANPRVTLSSGDIRVRSLIAREEFIMNGGSLTVTEASEVSARFEIGEGSTLGAVGRNALFIANGDTKIDGGNFTAVNGGTIQLPRVTSYTHTAGDIRNEAVLRATGAGSVIDLRNVTSITNGTGAADQIIIEALTGGVVDLRGVQNIVDSDASCCGPDSIYIRATGTGSLVDLSSLTTFANASPNLGEISVGTGGELRVPNLTTANSVLLKREGTGTLPIAQFTEFTDGRMELAGRAYVFSSLTNARGTEIVLADSAASVDLIQLTTIQDGSLELSNGASVAAAILSNINGANLLVSGGITLSLPSVTSFTHTAGDIRDDAVIRATGAGSMIDLRNVTSITNGTGAADRITIEALTGGAVDLRGVQNIVDSDASCCGADSTYIRATGTGSLVDLSSLTTFANASPNLGEISVATGGELRVPNLTTADGVLLKREGTGTLPIAQFTEFTDGRMELAGRAYVFSSLTNARGTEIVLADSAASVDLIQLTTIQDGSLELSNGASVAAAILSNINGANLLVSGGITLSLPSVTSFTHTAGDIRDDAVIRATGAGSMIDLRNVTSITNGTGAADRITIEALTGGAVDLRGVQNIVDSDASCCGADSTYIRATGTGSLVDLSSLTTFANASPNLGEISVATGGELRVPNLTTADGVLLKREGTGTLPIAQFTEFTDGRMELAGRAYVFSSLTNARGTEIVLADSAASVDLIQLTTIQDGSLELSNGASVAAAILSNINGANLLVSGGITLSLPSVTSFTHTAGDIRDDAVIRATGAGSMIDLRNVTSITNGAGAADRITIEALTGGVVDLRGVQNIVDNDASCCGPDSTYIRATGTGSLVNLTSLTTFANASPNLGELSVATGGELRVPNLTTADGVLLKREGTGTLPIAQFIEFTDGRMELAGRAYVFSSLTNASGTEIVLADSVASADLSQLTTIQDGSLELSNGASVAAAILSNINGANLLVSGGVTLSLPAVTSYTHTAGDIRNEAVLRATGAGSMIDLRNVTSITNGTGAADQIIIEALTGGVVDLRGVQNIVDSDVSCCGADSTYIRATGTGSLVALSSLTTFANASPNLGEISANNFGIVRLNETQTLLFRVMVTESGNGDVTGNFIVDNGLSLAPNLPADAGDAIAAPLLSVDELTTVFESALVLWSRALSFPLTEQFGTTRLEIGDLASNLLAITTDGAIIVDRDAAGFGWFVDTTPLEDEEFDERGRATAEAARQRVDLLSVVMHELGHLIGLEHGDGLAEVLDVGQRQLISDEALDELFAKETW